MHLVTNLHGKQLQAASFKEKHLLWFMVCFHHMLSDTLYSVQLTDFSKAQPQNASFH